MSGFHPDELNPKLSRYPVTKGDVPGHEFHGNQYTTEEHLAYDAMGLANKSLPNLGTTAEQPTLGHIKDNEKAYYTKMAQAHREIAAGHKIAGINVWNRHRDPSVSHRPSVSYASSHHSAQLNQDAADAHDKAADLYQKMADKVSTQDGPDELTKLVARSLTLSAAVASNKAAGGTSPLVD